MFRKVGTTALVLGLFVGVGIAVQALSPEVAYASFTPPRIFDWGKWGNSLAMWIGTFLAQIINIIGNAIGSLTLVIIEVIVVNVLSYNNFSSSSIVTLGWTLTRDMVNMFAVIVLLILAVKTMIGQESSAWQQHLPRFFLGIVFANFSRTICGLAVDASQIVMMTFVNALMSIAAGNFAQLMVMPQANTYSSPTFQGASEAGITLVTLASNIANAYIKLMVQVAVMIVILLLAVAFIWRIVMLWIAFIMAPFAGFAWGSMGIIKWLGRVWDEWVQGFVPPLILGPMLAFFLYLALAASSNGHLAKAEAFPEPEKRTTYGQITLEIFESTNFTGLLIAIVFLLMGIRESAKIASKMGGLAAMALNEKTGMQALSLGRSISGKALGLPLTGARVGSQLAGKVGGKLATTNMLATSSPRLNAMLQRTGKLTQTAAGAATTGLRYAENPLDAALRGGKSFVKGTGELMTDVGSATGIDALMKAGSAIDAKLHTLDESGIAGVVPELKKYGFSEGGKKAAKDRISHMTNEQKVRRLLNSVNGTGALTNEMLDDAKLLRGEIFTNKEFAEKLKKEVGNEKFNESIEKIFHDLQHEDEVGHLSVDKETWNKARSKYTDLYVNAAGQENAKKFIASDDFDIKKMRKEAVTSPAVAFALASAITGEKKDGKYQTKLDLLNDKQKEQVRGSSADIFKAFKPSMFTQDAGGKPGVSAAGGSIDDHLRAFSRMEGKTKLNDGVAQAIAARLQEIENNNQLKNSFQQEELAAIRKNLIASTKMDLNEVYGGEVYDSSFNVKNRKNFKALVSDDVSVLRMIDDSAFDNANQDTTKTVFEGLSKESMEKMKDLVSSGARSKADVDAALKKVERVLAAMEVKARNGVDKATLDDLQAQIKAMGEAAKNETDIRKKEGYSSAQAELAKRKKALMDQMDNDTLAKVKGLRASKEATERYL